MEKVRFVYLQGPARLGHHSAADGLGHHKARRFRERHPRRFLCLRGPPGFKRRVTSTHPTDEPSNAVSCEKAVEHYKSWSSYKPPSTLWV